MTVHTALLQGTRLLEDAAIAVPRLTAEVLLCHAMRRERPYLYAHPEQELTQIEWIHYGRYLHERLAGKPTQYITKRQEFYGREFRVTPDVLIPRPETEQVVEAALERAEDARTILDIGTGSGAIAVTLALERNAGVVATDISEKALAIAAQNAHKLGAAVRFVVCDLGSALRSNTFDLIVSNPPYVPEANFADIQREVRDFEPKVALFGGFDGLDVYRRLIPDARRLLRPGGFLIMEIGWSEAEPICAMLNSWAHVESRADLAG